MCLFIDAACRTYAIFASDGVGTDTGLTPNDNCIERGGIRILIDDGKDISLLQPENEVTGR